MQNFIRTNEYITLKKLCVGFASTALDFVTGGGLDHATIEMNGGLINLTLGVDVKITTPFLSIVNLASAYLAAFAHIGKVWQRVTMLHEWRNALNTTINCVH